MTEVDRTLVIGRFWRADNVRGHAFRYEGRANDGAYVFSRFAEPDRHDMIELIHIYNIDSMEPLA